MFARAFPFAVFIAFLAAQPLLERHFDPRWIVLTRGLVVAGALAFLWRAYAADFREKGRASDWALAIVLGLAVFGAWIAFDSGWAVLGTPGAGFEPLDAAGRIDPVLAALRLLQLVLVVPLMEELFWRSFLMRWIDRRAFLEADPRRASLFAMAAVSVLFALEHAFWFAGLLAGIVYTALYVRSGSLRVAVASHAVSNGALGAWILATGNWAYW